MREMAIGNAGTKDSWKLRHGYRPLATAEWVELQLAKRVGAPNFMVTLTVPEAKAIYQLLFAAAWLP
jgi:hypothetical protein